MQLNYEVDSAWCLEQLCLDGFLSERDQALVKTTQRKPQQMDWHPLRWIANFQLKEQRTQKLLDLPLLCQWFARKAQLPLYRIDPLKADVAALTEVMTQEFALKNHILAVEVRDNEVLVGTAQPFYLEWMQHLEQSLLPKKIVCVLLDPEQLQRYILEYYQVSDAVHSSQKASSYAIEHMWVEALLQLGEQLSPDVNDQHIVKLVDWVLQFAFEQRASDIHLEPAKDKGRVRFRIDGVLHSIYRMPSNTLTAVISRIKILGRLNVAEKRKPQDGRLKTRTPKGHETELRLSTLPTAFGEKLVLRIFDPEVLVRSFQQLGFSTKLLADWQKMTQQRHGIILVTGPTGSGKTTTLYSTLKLLATDQVNVCTVEDPIEMLEPSFNQMQVNPVIGLGFADGIRALMRQDPDIIMVGEIRDIDTANMAIQAALTGHLVLSTLHTNDASSILIRLHDLGVQAFLSSAQRLVRQLCSQCRVIQPIDLVQWQQLCFDDQIETPDQVYAAVGCQQCRHTGYNGRIALYEFMPISQQAKAKINLNASLEELRALAKQEGVAPLRIAGALQIKAGLTTLEEVLRVVPLH